MGSAWSAVDILAPTAIQLPLMTWSAGDRFQLTDDDAELVRECRAVGISYAGGFAQSWTGTIVKVTSAKTALVQYDHKESGVTDGIPLAAARKLQASCALDMHKQAVAKHRTFAGRYWGISKRQWRSFLSEVRAYHAAGKITNPEPGQEHHNPGFTDNNRGPNAHQVNRDVIVPVTRDPQEIRRITGRSEVVTHVSWALMMNPDGLLVDIFVSHCWEEGIFEMERCLDLPDCWTDEQNAYVCFLGNPQAWPRKDLEALLGHQPAASPFADALRCPSCTTMIMVSNGNVPIHSRLWCVFEAKLAAGFNKNIVLAGYAEDLFHHGEKPIVQQIVTKAKTQYAAVPVAAVACAAYSFGLSYQIFIDQCKSMVERFSVRNASCTDPNDEIAIREAIRGEEQFIDDMISGLMMNALRMGGGPGPHRMT